MIQPRILFSLRLQNPLILPPLRISRSVQLPSLLITFLSDPFLFVMKSFPPVDDFLTYLASDSFQNHRSKLIQFFTFSIALFYVLGERLGCWYKSGGKDVLVSYIQKLILFLMSFLNWCDTELIPSLYYVGPTISNAYQRIRSVFQNLLYCMGVVEIQP